MKYRGCSSEQNKTKSACLTELPEVLAKVTFKCRCDGNEEPFQAEGTARAKASRQNLAAEFPLGGYSGLSRGEKWEMSERPQEPSAQWRGWL